MTASEVGAVPDDVIEAVARVVLAILERDAPCSCLPAYKDRGLDDPQCTYHDVLGSEIDMARAFLSVPSVAEVFARDAKVREIVEAHGPGVLHCKAIAALYSEDGTR